MISDGDGWPTHSRRHEASLSNKTERHTKRLQTSRRGLGIGTGGHPRPGISVPVRPTRHANPSQMLYRTSKAVAERQRWTTQAKLSARNIASSSSRSSQQNAPSAYPNMRLASCRPAISIFKVEHSRIVQCCMIERGGPPVPFGNLVSVRIPPGIRNSWSCCSCCWTRPSSSQRPSGGG